MNMQVSSRSFYNRAYMPSLNAAIQTMAYKSGYEFCDTSARLDECPCSLKAITDYREDNGRFKIWTGECDDTIYCSPGINEMLRLWHDRVHYDHQFEFNVAGEAAACYVQIAELIEQYGFRHDIPAWAQLLLTDILGLVIQFRQAGDVFPTKKYKGTVDNMHKWKRLADKLVSTLWALPPGKRVNAAAQLAQEVWGNPY